MGGCCAGKSDDEEKAFEKGGTKDCSGGPVQNRSCTDIFCLVIFIAHWFGFAAVTLAGLQDGDPAKLYQPRDFKGDYCDLGDFKGHSKLMRTLNVSATVDTIAEQLVCSTAAGNALQAVMSTAEFASYQCACCLVPCATCDSNKGLMDLSDPSAASSTITSRMSELTDPSKGAQLFSSGSSNAMSFSAESMWKEMTKYMVPVCMMDSCIAPKVNSSTPGRRSYTYSPTPTVAWKFAWDTLATHASIPSGLKDTIRDQFTFMALPPNDCPYHERYCIPIPGVEFKEAAMNRCMPQLDDNVVSQLGTAACEALETGGLEAFRSAESNMSFFTELIATVDAFCVVAFFAFVLGLFFMVALRFLVGVVVWMSLFLVVVVLVGGGGLCYIRSFQCAGAGLFDTGLHTGVAALSTAYHTASNAVSGSEVLSEDMTGNGEDYRGGQTRTRSGKLCQRWDTQVPHVHSFTEANYPNASLINNYCRNPDGIAKSIWCYTTDTEKKWELCTPVGVILSECSSGYAVQDEVMREILKVVSYFIWALAAIWVIAICFLQKRIRLAVGVNQVAAMFIYNNPTILGVPVVQIFVSFAWLLIWIFCASFLLSQVPEGYTPTQYFATYAEAYGTDTEPGACTDKWPTGIVWKYEGNVSSEDDPCTGIYGDTSAADFEPKCWKCSPPRYVFDTRFAASFFTLLWNNAFLVALGQLIIAGACAQWFFTVDSKRGKTPTVRGSIWIAFRYHIGTVAFGAFILALVQFIRYLMKYFEKQAAAQKNRIVVLILKGVQCLLWCFEKCIKFLNKNAYIQTALMGTNFCTSAKNAFQLIMRNMLRFGVVAILGTIINAIGWVVITIGTTALGYFILEAFHPDTDPLVPMLSYFCVGYLTSTLFMNVFALGVDTSLQCFIAAEEMGIAQDYVPGPLKSLVDANPADKKSQIKIDISKVAPTPT
eukprot:gb/GFBE01001831.1/.p1 GENE.gb/GFBE01001831.1/~~gb/GFBE01001831.1/.p1  ORF type:complete len:938 (+),score=190.06 gb/GFBE01001831.1/:1-2814(+)